MAASTAQPLTEQPLTRIWAARDKLKAVIAARHSDLPPPRSTNDALLEAFAPSGDSGTYNLWITYELRGRVALETLQRLVAQLDGGELLAQRLVGGLELADRAALVQLRLEPRDLRLELPAHVEQVVALLLCGR